MGRTSGPATSDALTVIRGYAPGLSSSAAKAMYGNFTMRPGLRRLVRLTCFLATLYAAMTGALVWQEERLIFFPQIDSGTPLPEGFPAEDAWFTAADGTRLHGWFTEHPQPRAVVLFAHGNAGNVAGRAGRLLWLHAHGLSALMFDYRGYGRSSGTPTEDGVLQDVRAAQAWLVERTGVPRERLVLMGESLGGAVVVDLAAETGARALILENTFTNLPDVAAQHFPWLPVRWAMRTRLDSRSKIPNYRGPLLQVHGDADEIVPYELGQALFAAAREPKTWVRVASGHHNDPPAPQYETALEQFLQNLP